MARGRSSYQNIGSRATRSRQSRGDSRRRSPPGDVAVATTGANHDASAPTTVAPATALEVAELRGQMQQLAGVCLALQAQLAGAVAPAVSLPRERQAESSHRRSRVPLAPQDQQVESPRRSLRAPFAGNRASDSCLYKAVESSLGEYYWPVSKSPRHKANWIMAILTAAAAAAVAMNGAREDEKDGHGQDVVMPGFRFHPTEEELVEFYLRRKVEGKRFNVELITFLDLYRYDPWELPALAAIGEKEWFFYVPRDRKYRNGDRPNRVTTSGYWKATGADRLIRSEGSRSIGMKKTLVFYFGKAPRGIRTSWIMNEYRLPQSEKDRYAMKVYVRPYAFPSLR
ncbi:hypothetical protein Taro_024590 [Colocasia esculenta]|uniref:NAC domain-containing protein n=1 Tax=Colocasia esculenta TaxID=4460 RepID=A0A843VHW8_COLES|nr:hypothetical protein [Colocasia esculenta]